MPAQRSAHPLAALLLLLAAVPTSGQTPPAGVLRFSPDAPAPAATIAVEYRAEADALAAAPELVLRARLRTPRDGAYQRGIRHHTVATLARGADGVHRAAFRLPEGVVFGVFAVEDPAATVVDANDGAFWELLVHGADGRPLLAALEQRFNDLMGRDQRAVVETGRRMVELYPERPQSWQLLSAAEAWSAGAAGGGAAAEARRRRQAELDEALRARTAVSADDLFAMRWLTYGRPATEYWLERLLREHPAHHGAIAEAAMALQTRLGREDPGHLLAELDRLWDEHVAGLPEPELNEGHARLAGFAFSAAMRAGTRDDKLRWAERLEALDLTQVHVTDRLRGDPELRDEGVRRVRAEAARLRAAQARDRLLGRTAAEQARADAPRLGLLLSQLGLDLIRDGQQAAGRDSLEAAAALNRAPWILRAVANASFEAGDTGRALHWWARAAAHPTTPPAFADTVRERLGHHFDEASWNREVAAGRAELLRRTAADFIRRPVPGSLRLQPAGGDELPLAALLGPTATVVVFWSRHCGPSMNAMPEIQRLTAELEPRGVRILPVTADPPGEAFDRALHEAGLALPIFHDVTGEVTSTFNSWATPGVYILDDHGMLRVADAAVNGIRLYVDALEHAALAGNEANR
jgi:hypothetical protein